MFARKCNSGLADERTLSSPTWSGACSRFEEEMTNTRQMSGGGVGKNWSREAREEPMYNLKENHLPQLAGINASPHLLISERKSAGN